MHSPRIRSSRSHAAILLLVPFWILAVLAAALAPLPGTGLAQAEPLTIAVTIPPQEFFLSRIAGDLAEPVLLVPAGADPHTYEPKPSQAAALAKADLWLTIGVEFEQAWKDRLLSANPDLVLAAMDAGIRKIPMADHVHGDQDLGHEPGHEHDEHAAEHHGQDDGDMHAADLPPEEHHAEGEHHEGEEHSHHGGLDPHIWTDPVLAQAMARNTAQALADLDPAHAETYRANLDRLLAELDALDARLAQTFASLSPDQRKFLVFHPSWGYLADRYGLEQIAIQALGKEPGAKELKELIEFALKHHITTIFVQPQFSEKSARVVAGAIHGQVVRADPLAPDWEHNLEQVADAFRNAMLQEK